MSYMGLLVVNCTMIGYQELLISADQLDDYAMQIFGSVSQSLQQLADSAAFADNQWYHK